MANLMINGRSSAGYPPISDPVNMNVLIPCAGLGNRFKNAGYDTPKPLIDVCGKPMIQRVVENIGNIGHYTLVVLNDQELIYRNVLDEILPNFTLLTVPHVTEGAACTCLIASEYIRDQPLIITDSDKIMEWDANHFVDWLGRKNPEGALVTYTSASPKNSFVELSKGRVVRVVEKEPISDIACTGAYYWSNGSDFILSAQHMIQKNKRVNNEFYVAPVYNEMIDRRILIYPIQRHWPLGTPEDLEKYRAEHCGISS